jgi:hypothetical protein
MSAFAAGWLALREPLDRRSRNAVVLDAVGASFAALPSISIVDLACGTGATMRAIATRLPRRQSWRLVDNDLSLLARVPLPDPSADLRVATVPLDISHDLEAALDGPLDLVTASALLDLVSADWLERMVVETAARRLPVYVGLTYEGTIAFEPADARDGAIVGAVNRHQRGNKGFGAALGPQAAAEAIRRFERAGYAVTQGRSDWILTPADVEMQNEVLAGWARATRENGSVALSEILDWLTHRRDLVTAGRSSIEVGHLDFFAVPTATR